MINEYILINCSGQLKVKQYIKLCMVTASYVYVVTQPYNQLSSTFECSGRNKGQTMAGCFVKIGHSRLLKMYSKFG